MNEQGQRQRSGLDRLPWGDEEREEIPQLDHAQRKMIVDAGAGDGSVHVTRRWGKEWTPELEVAEGLLGSLLAWGDLNVDTAKKTVTSVYKLTQYGWRIARHYNERPGLRRCRRGHLQTEDNVFLTLRKADDRVVRGCLVCRRITRRAFDLKRRRHRNADR